MSVSIITVTGLIGSLAHDLNILLAQRSRRRLGAEQLGQRLETIFTNVDNDPTDDHVAFYRK